MEETKASGGQDGEQVEGEGRRGRRKKGLVFLEGELELKEISREGCFLRTEIENASFDCN